MELLESGAPLHVARGHACRSAPISSVPHSCELLNSCNS